MLLAMTSLSGCLATSASECTVPNPELIPGTRLQYQSPSDDVHLEIHEATHVSDGMGQSRHVTPVHALTDHNASATVYYVAHDTGHVIRTERQEAPGSPSITEFLQPTPNYLVHERFFGDAPFLLPLALTPPPIMNEPETTNVFGLDVTAHWTRDGGAWQLTYQFDQPTGPDTPPLARTLVLHYACGAWPIAFGELVGLGHGFQDAELARVADAQNAKPSPISIGHHEERTTHVDATPSPQPHLASPHLASTMAQAKATAQQAPQYMLNYAPGHPNHFLAAVFIEQQSLGQTWTVQFAQVTGQASYETSASTHDVQLLVVPGANPLIPVQEGSLKRSIIADYPAMYWAPNGFATLSHAVDHAFEQLEQPNLAFVAQLEPERYPGIEDAILVAEDDTTRITYSAINGQIIRHQPFS